MTLRQFSGPCDCHECVTIDALTQAAKRALAWLTVSQRGFEIQDELIAAIEKAERMMR